MSRYDNAITPLSEREQILAEFSESPYAQEAKERIKQQNIDAHKKFVESVQPGAAATAGEIIQGVGTALPKLMNNAYKGFLALDNFIGGKSQPTRPMQGMDWKVPEGAAESGSFEAAQRTATQMLSPTGKTAQAITELSFPILGSMAVTGPGLAGFAAGTSVDAVYGFLSSGPDERRLSQYLKGTSLYEVPVAQQVLEYLGKDTEDELEARTLGALESAGISTAIGAAVIGVGKLLKAKEGIDAIKRGEPPPTTPTKKSVADVPATPVTKAEEAGLQASDVAVSKIDPVELSESQKVYAEIGPRPKIVEASADGAPIVDLRNESFWNQFTGWVQKLDVENGKRLRTPMTDEETQAAAKALMDEADELPLRLAAWTAGEAIPTDKQILALRYALHDGVQQISTKTDELLAKFDEGTITDAVLVGFDRDFDGVLAATAILKGTASEAAARLRAEQLLGRAAKLGDVEALATIGAKGRATMMTKLLENAGGKEGIKSTADKLSLIRQLQKVQKLPDSMFTEKMGEVVLKSSFMRVEDALTSVALNGMLYSPKTWVRASIGNFVTTTKTAVDNYVAAIVEPVFAGKNKVLSARVAEANAAVAAQMKTMLQAASFNPRLTYTTKEMQKLGTARAIRLDYDQMAVQKSSVQAGEAGFFSAASDKMIRGLEVAAGSKANQLPRNVLIGVDTYWQEVNVQMYLAGQAVKEGMSRGLSGSSLDEFVDAYKAAPPSDVLERAYKQAQSNTMAKQLSEWNSQLEAIYSGLDVGIERVPFGRVLFPFFKTAANMSVYAVENSAFKAIVMPSEFARVLRTGTPEAKSQMIAKMSTGTMMMASLAYLANQGLVKGAEKDWRKERALRDNKEGPQSTSFKIGDQWVKMSNLDPITSLLEASVFLNKAAGYVMDGEMSDAIVALSSAFMETANPDTVLESFSKFLGVVSGDVSIEDYLKDQPQKFLPAGALARDIRNYADSAQRSIKPEETGSALGDALSYVKNTFMNRIPGMSDDLPPVRNLLGEVVTLPDGIGPDIMSPVASSKHGSTIKLGIERLDSLLATLGDEPLRIQMPSDVIEDLQLTPKEYDRYVAYVGGIDPSSKVGEEKAIPGVGTMRAALENALQGVQELDPADKEKIYQVRAKVQRAIRERTELGKQLLMNEPEFKLKMQEHQRLKMKRGM